MPKHTFEFKVIYFKDSGKSYISESFFLEADNCASPGYPVIAYMQDAVDHLKKANQEGFLPGLQSGKWDGHILVTCEYGYPCLIIPDVILTFVRSLKPI